MSLQITTSMVNKFSADAYLLAQQKGSRLMSCCRVETQNAEFAYYDQIGVVDAVQRASRHADTPYTEVPYARRRVGMDDWELGELIDKQDKIRTLLDAQGWYTRAFAAGMGRRIDDTIIAQFFATAFTGKSGGTSTAFLAGNQIANNFVETGSAITSGLTIGKLRKAKELLDGAEAGVDPDEPRFVACSSREITQLLRTVEVTSADYNTVGALQAGKVNDFMGFTFIRTERLLLDGSNYRRVMAWVQSGMLFALGEMPETNAAPDPTKGFSIRLHMKASFGATRFEEAKCVEIKCDPAA